MRNALLWGAPLLLLLVGGALICSRRTIRKAPGDQGAVDAEETAALDDILRPGQPESRLPTLQRFHLAERRRNVRTPISLPSDDDRAHPSKRIIINDDLPNPLQSGRTRLLAAAASVAIAGAIGLGAVTSGTGPVHRGCRPRQTAPQAPGFADVVEKVSPAVVSVRVKAKIEPASDDGARFDADAWLRQPAR